MDMSTRWYNATVRAMREAGGWTGPATLRALHGRMVDLHTLRLSTRAAGNVLAREYQLHSAMCDYRELAAI